MSADPIDDPELLSIISSALEMRDEGIEPPVEQLCGNRPDLVSAVREAIQLVGNLPAMQERASGRDPHYRQVLRGRYRLESRIGSGAMGVVYKARDLELQRPVAVKILRTAAIGAEEAEQRFVREAELLAAIRHPAVITIHDRGVTEHGEQFLVTELLEGTSLADLLDEGRRRESAQEIEGTAWIAAELGAESLSESSYLRTVVRWAADLAAGLNAAHEAGVVHRDVKPSNVFIDSEGKPLLLDFGIAASSAHATLMREGGALGTPAYMAPESLNADVETQPTLDVYSLSATLYHMLVCQAPYQGSPSQVISALGAKEPPPAYKLRPGLPRDLQAILDKGMARRVSERYGSALELESDLRAFLNYRPVSARPITAAGRVWRKLRRSTAFYAATGVALVAISIAVGADLKAKRQVIHDAAFMDVWEHLPPGLGVDPEAPRRIVDRAERSYVEGVLDDALRWRPDSVQARLIRASFRLDHEDPAGAAEDMLVVSGVLGTSYAAALAKRYQALPADAVFAKSLNLEGLPEPTTPLDCYVAGFHQQRTGRKLKDFLRVRELLETQGLEEHTPSLELLIPLYGFLNRMEFMGNELPTQEQLSRSLENYARAERLEEQVGQRTATTALLIGTTLITSEIYWEAIDPLREGVELCPHSYGLRLNRSIAARRLRETEEALEQITAAMKMRPKSLSTFTTLARIHIIDGELERARRVVASAPFDKSSGHRKLKLELEGDIEFAETLRLHNGGAVEQSLISAGLALEKFEALLDLEERSNRSEDERKSTFERKICEALVQRDKASLFGHLADLMCTDPLRWKELGSLIGWMPEDLDAEQTHKMLEYLQQLRRALSRVGE